MELSWRPSASHRALRHRAELLARTRRFFLERNVLEVETPLIGSHPASDLHLHSIACRLDDGGQNELDDGSRHFLLTSPELPMKRLLAAGVGSIFQVCKAFRDAESGRHHNPEFTILEWYRIGFDHHQLMHEVAELIDELVPEKTSRPPRYVSYAELFEQLVAIDPHRCRDTELVELLGDARPATVSDRDEMLQLVMSELIEPSLEPGQPTFVYDYPGSQAALAAVRREGDVELAERFELYLGGVELANGFHELRDAGEQRARFEHDRDRRRLAGLPTAGPDERFLAALTHGLPACAGVALGFDRLLMVALDADHIDDVISFPLASA